MVGNDADRKPYGPRPLLDLLMNLSFRTDMKMIVHEVNGEPVTVMGKTIDVSSTAILSMMETAPDADHLNVGSRVRCSYVDAVGVHEFHTAVTAIDTLTLNHRLFRLSIGVPSSAEHIQRRNHVRAGIEIPVLVESDGEMYACTSVDLSAGGIAVVWPADTDVVDTGEMVEVRFRSDRFEHHHIAQVLGPYPRGKLIVVRLRFEGMTRAGEDRLATVVAAAQREERQRQRNTA